MTVPMLPAGFDRSALLARRERLSRLLGDGAALLASGTSRGRNYAANPYPFRAASHFLYLVGAPLENAMLFHEAGKWTLFVEPPAADDALWHGESMGLAALSRRDRNAIRARC